MKHLLAFLLALFMACSTQAADPPTVNQVKLTLIRELQSDGSLTQAQALEATKRYVAVADSATPAAAAKIVVSEPAWWSNWIDILKVLGVLALLIALSGWIKMGVMAAWSYITAVPVIVYQGIFLAATLIGTVMPGLYWASQAFYVTLFCVFANLLIIGWIFAYNPALAEWFRKLFSLGVPPSVVAAFYGMAYFAVLAIVHSSQIFGFFAAVCFSAMFGFGMFYIPGVLYLDVSGKAANSVIISHTLILSAYTVASLMGAPHLALFVAGFEYYCPIGLGLALLIGASPWSGRFISRGILMFIVVLVLANIAFSFGMRSIGSIIDIFAVLFLLEWLLYACWSVSILAGVFVTGVTLFGGGLFLESHGATILKALGAA